MYKEKYLQPKNNTIPNFRAWLKRNFADYELAESLDTILYQIRHDKLYQNGYATVGFHNVVDEDGVPVYDYIDGGYKIRREFDNIYYTLHEPGEFTYHFEITDGHYYAFIREA